VLGTHEGYFHCFRIFLHKISSKKVTSGIRKMPVSRTSLADFYLTNNDREAAKAELERTLVIDPDNIEPTRVPDQYNAG